MWRNVKWASFQKLRVLVKLDELSPSMTGNIEIYQSHETTMSPAPMWSAIWTFLSEVCRLSKFDDLSVSITGEMKICQSQINP